MTTLLVIIASVNFRKPEKTIKHRVTHLHAVETAQFKREMGLLLGPAILSGNQVTPLQNGDEIFPAMLSAIREGDIEHNVRDVYLLVRKSRRRICRRVDRARACRCPGARHARLGRKPEDRGDPH